MWSGGIPLSAKANSLLPQPFVKLNPLVSSSLGEKMVDTKWLLNLLHSCGRRGSPRMKEIEHYIANFPKSPKPCSLAYIILSIMEHAGPMRESLLKTLFCQLLRDPSIPLENVAKLRYHPTLASYLNLPLSPTRGMEIVSVGDYKIAFCFSSANYAKEAFQSGAHLYVALSQRGIVLMANKGVPQLFGVLDEVAKVIGGEWKHLKPYVLVTRQQVDKQVLVDVVKQVVESFTEQIGGRSR